MYNMTKTLLLLLVIFALNSCTHNREDKSLIKPHEDSLVPEENHKSYRDSIIEYKIEPLDSLLIKYEISQRENYILDKNTVEIYKKDSFNIDELKINSNIINLNKLKTINPRLDGSHEEMFCQSLQRIKLYKFKNDEIVFLEFTSHPCNGLGCSVSDYLIYNSTKNQVSFFGTFRSANLDFFDFPFNSELNYISTEYKGETQNETPIQYVSRIYSMSYNGIFELTTDSLGNEYFIEENIFPNKPNDYYENYLLWYDE